MIQKNEVYTVSIEDLTEEGAGVARIGDMVVFIPDVAVSDLVECKIVKVKPRYAYAILQKIIKPSEHRIQPACALHQKCGGCTLQQIDYQSELVWKQKRVRDCFLRIGGIDQQLEPIIGADSVFRYRNKAQYPLAVQNGRVVCGFYAKRSHRVVSCEDCALQPEIFSQIVSIILQFCNRVKLSVYQEQTGEGLLRHIYLRRGEVSGEIMLCLVATSLEIPHLFELIAELKDRFPQIVSYLVNQNDARTNVILGEKTRVLAGKDCIQDVLCGVSVSIAPQTFYQVHHAQAERLYQVAAEFAGRGELLLDLYCGAGTIGLSMADQFSRVVGVDKVKPAIENAIENAGNNQIPHASFFVADAKEGASILLERGDRPDVVVVDPPRKGCGEKTIEAIRKLSPDRIVMISCNPSTVARDVGQLVQCGYRVVRIRPVDLFPRTTHVECVVLLSRKPPDSIINVKVEFGDGRA